MVDQVGSAPADAVGERLVRVRDPEPRIADHHQIGERVERAFELAPGPKDVLEQKDALDDAGHLTPDLLHPFEHFDRVVAGLHAQAAQFEGPQRAASAAERDHHVRCTIARDADHLGAGTRA